MKLGIICHRDSMSLLLAVSLSLRVAECQFFFHGVCVATIHASTPCLFTELLSFYQASKELAFPQVLTFFPFQISIHSEDKFIANVRIEWRYWMQWDVSNWGPYLLVTSSLESFPHEMRGIIPLTHPPPSPEPAPLQNKPNPENQANHTAQTFAGQGLFKTAISLSAKLLVSKYTRTKIF